MANVLVVEDEKDLVLYLADELKEKGYETGTAYDGVDAVLKVIEGDWDVVLMDIRMPNMDGINALRIIRRISPGLPVIMFTGQAGQTEMLETTRLGAITCLLKPIVIENLVKILEQLF